MKSLEAPTAKGSCAKRKMRRGSSLRRSAATPQRAVQGGPRAERAYPLWSFTATARQVVNTPIAIAVPITGPGNHVHQPSVPASSTGPRMIVA